MCRNKIAYRETRRAKTRLGHFWPARIRIASFTEYSQFREHCRFLPIFSINKYQMERGRSLACCIMCLNLVSWAFFFSLRNKGAFQREEIQTYLFIQPSSSRHGSADYVRMNTLSTSEQLCSVIHSVRKYWIITSGMYLRTEWRFYFATSVYFLQSSPE